MEFVREALGPAPVHAGQLLTDAVAAHHARRTTQTALREMQDTGEVHRAATGPWTGHYGLGPVEDWQGQFERRGLNLD
jgi:hypothetical protein